MARVIASQTMQNLISKRALILAFIGGDLLVIGNPICTRVPLPQPTSILAGRGYV